MDAALLSTPSSASSTCAACRRSTHSRDVDACPTTRARRPSLGNARPEHSVPTLERLHCRGAGDEEAEAGGYGFNYLDDGRQLASDYRRSTGVSSTISSTTSAGDLHFRRRAVRVESLEELEQLEALNWRSSRRRRRSSTASAAAGQWRRKRGPALTALIATHFGAAPPHRTVRWCPAARAGGALTRQRCARWRARNALG